jgi:RNA polymerase-binding transcription factor DksA
MQTQSTRPRNLAATRHLLVCRQQELRERLARLETDKRRNSEPLSPDFAEQASQRENDEVVDALHLRTHAELQAVEQALSRLEKGLYGRCTQCGEAIETPRLMAVPHTDLCGPCADTAAPRG